MHIFEQHLDSYTPKDPLYETYVDDKGRERRRKREVPPGLSKRDEKILKSVKRRAHYLDKGFKLCGMRFGWTFIIGFIPVVGDITDAVLNYTLIVRKARQAELPDWLVRKMLFNNAVSAGVGLVPIVGDVVLAAFKANSRNAWLLDEYLRIRGEELLKVRFAPPYVMLRSVCMRVCSCPACLPRRVRTRAYQPGACDRYGWTYPRMPPPMPSAIVASMRVV